MENDDIHSFFAWSGMCNEMLGFWCGDDWIPQWISLIFLRRTIDPRQYIVDNVETLLLRYLHILQNAVFQLEDNVKQVEDNFDPCHPKS